MNYCDVSFQPARRLGRGFEFLFQLVVKYWTFYLRRYVKCKVVYVEERSG
jgi:hypothetical protein